MYIYKGVTEAERFCAPDWELRSKVVGSKPPDMQAIFQPRNEKKIKTVPSVRLIAISYGDKLLWRDSDKGVDHALTWDESIMLQIIILLKNFLSSIYSVRCFWPHLEWKDDILHKNLNPSLISWALIGHI